MPLQPRTGISRRIAASRSGTSSLAFAGGAVTLFGAVAMATDAGLFYAARRGAQNAADAAASAAVVELALSGRAVAMEAGRSAAGRNGFAHNGGTTNVAVNIPPATGERTGHADAVEVIVQQTQGMGTAALFMSAPPAVVGRAVAWLRRDGDICILALTGPATAAGDASGASGCAMSGVATTGRGVPADNPFVHLDAKPMPAPGAADPAIAPGGPDATPLPFEANGRVLRGDLTVTAGQVLTLQPGTYYIHDGSFDVRGGEVRCPGCTEGRGVTFVLTGTPAGIGGVRIGPEAKVELRAPRVSADPAYSGILFHRDARAAPGGAAAPAVRISGAGGLSLSGGMYFPNAHVRLGGNSASVTCAVVVAGSVEFAGHADTRGCAAAGTAVPGVRVVERAG